VRLFLIRHGQTAWNQSARAQGHTDIPLDEEGIRQALQLGRHFESIPLAKVFTSDLVRSRVTAEAISKTGVIVDPLLRERSFGDWEGLPFAEIRNNIERESLRVDPFEVCPPGGESMTHAWERAAKFVQEHVSQLDEDAAIISHGGTCSLLLSIIVKGTLSSAVSFRFANASVTELERAADGRFRLIRYNDVSHLNEDALVGDLYGSYR